MKSCEQCIHFKACANWQRFLTPESLGFPFECEDEEELCDNYSPITLLPIYIGMKVWAPYIWQFKEARTELREGSVSSLQQKADSSWKIRVTYNGPIAGYTIDYAIQDFNKRCFLNKHDAENYIESNLKESANTGRIDLLN